MSTVWALAGRLQLDVILNVIGIVFVGIEIPASLFTGYNFYSAYRG